MKAFCNLAFLGDKKSYSQKIAVNAWIAILEIQHSL